MKKSEMKEIAKEVLMSALSVAYYRISDEGEYSEEEEEEIIQYINKYATSMAKSIGKSYYTQ